MNGIFGRCYKKVISGLMVFIFAIVSTGTSYAQNTFISTLPEPGAMVGTSASFIPLALKGLAVNLQKPLEFKFIVDTGTGSQDAVFIKEEANKLIKYFLAGLTIPEGDLWVNLSPYENDRITTGALGRTELGRDLLAQDYILKQLTASLIYPEKDLGKEFWGRVYKRAQEELGATDIPVNTFNKVWILPDQTQVFENVTAAYVTKSTLKVMLDEDYLAKGKNQSTPASTVSSQVIREIVIPEIEKEVNIGKNFAPLRQIYQALILAKWYKETIQNGLLDAVYTNRNKTAGVNVSDPFVKEQIYERYLEAYKKGVFNYIKEDQISAGQVVPRKYFSGGFSEQGLALRRDGAMAAVKADGAMLCLDVDLEKSKDTAMSAEIKLKEARGAVIPIAQELVYFLGGKNNDQHGIIDEKPFDAQDVKAGIMPVIHAVGSPAPQSFYNAAKIWEKYTQILKDNNVTNTAGVAPVIPIVITNGRGRGYKRLVINTFKFIEAKKQELTGDPNEATRIERIVGSFKRQFSISLAALENEYQLDDGDVASRDRIAKAYDPRGLDNLNEARVIKLLFQLGSKEISNAENEGKTVFYMEEVSSNTHDNMTLGFPVLREAVDRTYGVTARVKIHIIADAFHRMRAVLQAKRDLLDERLIAKSHVENAGIKWEDAVTTFTREGIAQVNKFKTELMLTVGPSSARSILRKRFPLATVNAVFKHGADKERSKGKWLFNGDAAYIPDFTAMNDQQLYAYLKQMIGDPDQPNPPFGEIGCLAENFYSDDSPLESIFISNPSSPTALQYNDWKGGKAQDLRTQLLRNYRNAIDFAVSETKTKKKVEKSAAILISQLIQQQIPEEYHNFYSVPNLPLYAHEEGPIVTDHLQLMLAVVNDPSKFNEIPKEWQAFISSHRRFFEKFILLHDIGKGRIYVHNKGAPLQSYPGHEAISSEMVDNDPGLTEGVEDKILMREVIRLHGTINEITKKEPGTEMKAAIRSLLENITPSINKADFLNLLIAGAFVDLSASLRKGEIAVKRVIDLLKALDFLRVKLPISVADITTRQRPDLPEAVREQLRVAMPILKNVVLGAGVIIDKERSKGIAIQGKEKAAEKVAAGTLDVTQTDFDVQGFVLTQLLKKTGGLPFKFRITAEESEGDLGDLIDRNNSANASADYEIIVDPIDGTKGFKDPKSTFFGSKFFLLYKGEIIAAFYLTPEHEISLLTSMGQKTFKGALFEASELEDGVFVSEYKNGAVSNKSRVIENDRRSDGQEDEIIFQSRTEKPFVLNTRGFRENTAFSSAGLKMAVVALGRPLYPSAFIDGGNNIWDVGDGIYFIEKMGGVAVRPDGSPVLPFRQETRTRDGKWVEGFIAGDKQSVERLLGKAGISSVHRNEDFGQIPGGIDLDQINVKHSGKTVNIQFDQSQLNELMRGGVEGFSPVIISITPIENPLMILGVNQAEAMEVHT